LREMSTPTQAEAIRRGEVDLGFLRLPANTTGLVERTVRIESMAVMVPREHPLARLERIPLPALEDEPMILFPAAPRPSWADTVIDACRQAGFEPRIAQQAIESAAVVSFVAAGIGVAVVPEGLRVLVRPEVAYRPVLPPAPTTRLALVRRPGETAPTVTGFLEVLDERWPEPDAGRCRG
jgi:LysR family transcriptional regulator, benzoate and cis,cis-muconate-responsive activator of ben and cat genes